jgi:hypothetical protein
VLGIACDEQAISEACGVADVGFGEGVGEGPFYGADTPAGKPNGEARDAGTFGQCADIL